jgi:hypothetical protein
MNWRQAIRHTISSAGFKIIKMSDSDVLHKNRKLDQILPSIFKGYRVSSIDPRRFSSNRRRIRRLEKDLLLVSQYAMQLRWDLTDKLENHSEIAALRECPICDEKISQHFKVISSVDRFFGGTLIRWKCPTCSVIFGPKKILEMSQESLGLEYALLYSHYPEGDTTLAALSAFQFLNPDKKGMYLDFGTGGEWSRTVEALRAQGFDVYGYDPYSTSKSKYVFNNITDLATMKFDGVMTNNVLEHLIDPVTTNQTISKILKENGTLVHATACFEYVYEWSRFHTFFFLERSAEVLAEKSGFKIHEWHQIGESKICVMKKN